MLPGSLNGIKYYLTPNFTALWNANVSLINSKKTLLTDCLLD